MFRHCHSAFKQHVWVLTTEWFTTPRNLLERDGHCEAKCWHHIPCAIKPKILTLEAVKLVTIRITVVWDLRRTARCHTAKLVHVEHAVNKTSLGRVIEYSGTAMSESYSFSSVMRQPVSGPDLFNSSSPDVRVFC